jgi:hypothetical protein
MSGTWASGWVTGNIVSAAEFKKGMGAIYDTTLSSSAATIDITSIISDYAHLRLYLYGRSDNATSFVSANLRLNNDSGTIYDHQLLRSVGATASAQELFGQTSAYIGDIPGSTAAVDSMGGIVVDIYKYTQAADHHIWTANNFVNVGQSTGQLATRWHGGTVRLLAAINRLTLVTSGNFIGGTRVTLYALGA